MKLEITRRAELAVRALALLSRTGERMKAPLLAEALGTTSAFVPQVLGPLVRAGWVRSDPGPLGGYVSLVELDDISLLDVIQTVDGAEASQDCIVGGRGCRDDDPCVMHTAWSLARTELLKILDATPMSSIEVVGGRAAEGFPVVRLAGYVWGDRADPQAGSSRSPTPIDPDRVTVP